MPVRTDVNIAAIILFDAFNKRCDNALLVSGDTDLIGPLNMMKQMFPAMKRTVAFPPGRYSGHLVKSATGWLHIGEDKFAKACFRRRSSARMGSSSRNLRSGHDVSSARRHRTHPSNRTCPVAFRVNSCTPPTDHWLLITGHRPLSPRPRSR